MTIRLSVVALEAAPVCELGEGPLWDPRIDSLVWVDVPAGLIHTLEIGTDRLSSVSTGAPTACVLPRDLGGYVVGLRDGIYTLSDSGELSPLARVPPHAETARINDGKYDPLGALWFGTLSNEGKFGLDTLYRLSPSGELTRQVEGITISNGLAWTADRSTMYYIDTPTSRIDAFSFSSSGSAAGEISARRPFVEIPYTQGFPDGMCIDAEDCLWVALFGGSAVHRYAPTGELIAVVEVPTADVTSCAFGGADLATLYITTAQWGGLGTKKQTDPEAGLVYVADPGVRGAPVGSYSG